MKRLKARSSRALLLAALLVGLWMHEQDSVRNAAAYSENSPLQSVLNPDGTLNLNTGFSGPLDLTGWDVTLDSARGPMLTPQDWGASDTGSESNIGLRFEPRVLTPIVPQAVGWSALPNSGLNGTVRAIAVSGSDVYVGGEFTATADGAVPNLNFIAKFSGGVWSPLPNNGLNNYVRALAVSASGDLYVGGDFFVTADGAVTNLNHIAKFSGGVWSALPNNGLNPVNVQALAVSGSDLYAGGFFTGTADGAVTNLNMIAKLSGGVWSPLPNNGLNTTVQALAVSGSDLYVGGGFNATYDAAVTLNHIARFSGGAWSALPNNGLNGAAVHALAVIGSDLYVAGESTSTFDGAVTNLNGIAKFSGGAWSGLPNNGLNGIEWTLAVNGSDLYVGGGLTQTFDGAVKLNNIAKFSGGVWTPLPNNGLNAQVNALAVNDSGDLYAGGEFTATRDFIVTNLFRIARFSSAPAPTPTPTPTPTPVCTFSLSPTSQNFDAGGGSGSVNVITALGCSWTTFREQSWITITSGASGIGNGAVNYSVAPNNGIARTGTIKIGGQTFTVTQDGLNTPIGSNVTVQLNGINITFNNVLAVGDTTVTPLVPPNPVIPQLPPGFVLFNNLAFDISTTATVTGPIIVTFDLGRLQIPNPPPITPEVFASLRVFHLEGGVLTDRTLPTPPPIVPAGPPIMPLFATVNSLGTLVIAQLVNNTPAGSNVVVQLDGISIFFTNVSALGNTIVAPTPPPILPLPPGFAIFNNLAFDISTTATVTGPIVVTFDLGRLQIPGAPPITPQVFASLRVFHGEGGVLTDRTIPNPPPIIPSAPPIMPIFAKVSSLSPFVIAQLVNHPPVASCKNIEVAAGSSRTATINPTDVDAGSSDPDPGDSITLSLDSTGPFGLGPHTVTLTVTDNHGASSSCGATVTVKDNTPPQITCPTNMTVEFTGEMGAVVTFPLPAATDNCAVASVVCLPPSGSVFPIGTTTVNCSATDGSGNKAVCAFNVTVLGARGVKQDVLAEMTALRPGVANREDNDNLDEAIKTLSESLDPRLWLDQTHVQSKEGKRAFDLEKDTVEELHDLIKEKESAIPDAMLQDFINRIVKSDRLLALVAINDAIAVHGDPENIDKARQEFAKGDSDVASGKYESGIEHYLAAWKRALEAVSNDERQ